MSNHTPGPWKIEDEEASGGWPIIASDGADGYIYVAQCEWIGDGDEQSKANARLIAAAPALLEACKEILRALAFVPGIKGHKEMMEACSSVGIAIATAEGR